MNLDLTQILIFFYCLYYQRYLLLYLFFGNIIPLHLEISKWTQNDILKQTAVPQWIKRHTKVLYLLSVVTGSSFSAISLCNSYLFKWDVFSMGLPHYHRSVFQNTRFFSVVLLEV